MTAPFQLATLRQRLLECWRELATATGSPRRENLLVTIARLEAHISEIEARITAKREKD